MHQVRYNFFRTLYIIPAIVFVLTLLSSCYNEASVNKKHSHNMCNLSK